VKSGRIVLLALLIGAGASGASAQPSCECSVYVIVEGHRIDLYHDGALFNCCPAFETQYSMEGDRIVVREIEWGLHPCRCLCCMNLSTSIENVPPGEYTLDLYTLELFYYTDPRLVASVPVIVSDEAPNPVAGTEVVDFRSSGCLEEWPDDSGGDAEMSWSMLKIFYR